MTCASLARGPRRTDVSVWLWIETTIYAIGGKKVVGIVVCIRFSAYACPRQLRFSVGNGDAVSEADGSLRKWKANIHNTYL